MCELIAATTAATDPAAAEAGFTGKVAVLGHRFLERVEIVRHHGLGESAAFVGLDPFELGGAGTQDRQKQGETIQ